VGRMERPSTVLSWLGQMMRSWQVLISIDVRTIKSLVVQPLFLGLSLMHLQCISNSSKRRRAKKL
jgi:hypothetical protein